MREINRKLKKNCNFLNSLFLLGPVIVIMRTLAQKKKISATLDVLIFQLNVRLHTANS